MKTMLSKTVAAIGSLAMFAGLAALPLQAQDVLVDLELSLVVDVSGSVDSDEYTLQMNGYALAFETADLQAAIAAGGQGQIAVNLIQFSDSAAQSIPWTLISDAASANAFAQAVRSATRLFDGLTSISAGIDTAAASFAGNGFSAPRQVIDVSGDGENNYGRDVSLARDDALAGGVETINGVVIGDPSGTLAQHYEDNVVSPDGFVEQADDFADFEPAILQKLRREIIGDTPLPMAATLRVASIGLVRSQTRDVGRRIARLRSGVGAAMVQPAPAPVVTDAKGGMPKGGMVAAAPYPRRWEVYGGMFYYTEDGDRQDYRIPGTTANLRVLPDYDFDVFGGHAGVEYQINDNWAVGGALAASRGDLDLDDVGSADIDGVALIPYVSFVQRNVFASADFYADLLYSHSWLDYDTRRAGLSGSTDGDADQAEFTTGLNFRNAGLVHGPYALLRWIDGDIDGFTEEGGTVYPSLDYESLATNLGYQVAYPVSMAGGTLVPQFWAAWEHEFEDDGPTVFGIPLGGEVDEDLAVVGTGIGWYAASGWNVGLDYEGRFGSDVEAHYVGVKAGYEF